MSLELGPVQSSVDHRTEFTAALREEALSRFHRRNLRLGPASEEKRRSPGSFCSKAWPLPRLAVTSPGLSLQGLSGLRCGCFEHHPGPPRADDFGPGVIPACRHHDEACGDLLSGDRQVWTWLGARGPSSAPRLFSR